MSEAVVKGDLAAKVRPLVRKVLVAPERSRAVRPVLTVGREAL